MICWFRINVWKLVLYLDSTAVSIFVVILVELTNTVFVNSTNISTNIEVWAADRFGEVWADAHCQLTDLPICFFESTRRANLWETSCMASSSSLVKTTRWLKQQTALRRLEQLLPIDISPAWAACLLAPWAASRQPFPWETQAEKKHKYKVEWVDPKRYISIVVKGVTLLISLQKNLPIMKIFWFQASKTDNNGLQTNK